MPEYWFHFTQCCCSRSYLIFSKGTFLEDEEVPLLKLEKYLFEPKKGTFLNQKGTFFRPKVPFSLILLLKKVPVRDLFPRLKNNVPFFFKYTLKGRLFFRSFLKKRYLFQVQILFCTLKKVPLSFKKGTVWKY